MSNRKLRAVGEDETPPLALPKTLSDAVEMDRRAFLVRSRLEIAKVIDAGVPAHALGRLISDMRDLDSEVRRLDAIALEESSDVSTAEDGAFIAEAI